MLVCEIDGIFKWDECSYKLLSIFLEVVTKFCGDELVAKLTLELL
jgi:hypothetical protein